jgi:hypothetical protein
VVIVGCMPDLPLDEQAAEVERDDVLHGAFPREQGACRPERDRRQAEKLG